MTETQRPALTETVAEAPEETRDAPVDAAAAEAAATAKPATPTTAPAAGIAATTTAVVVPVWTTAEVRVAGLEVQGSLPDGDVRRAVERLEPGLRGCYARVARAAGRSPAATVRVMMGIGAARRAANVRVVGAWAELGTCARAEVEKLRVAAAPDVGEVAVVVELAFRPVAP